MKPVKSPDVPQQASLLTNITSSSSMSPSAISMDLQHNDQDHAAGALDYEFTTGVIARSRSTHGSVFPVANGSPVEHVCTSV